MTKNPNINLYTDFNNTAEGFSPFEADEIYSDTVTVGDTEFEVIKTPGHSNGSICLMRTGSSFRATRFLPALSEERITAVMTRSCARSGSLCCLTTM